MNELPRSEVQYLTYSYQHRTVHPEISLKTRSMLNVLTIKKNFFLMLNSLITWNVFFGIQQSRKLNVLANE